MLPTTAAMAIAQGTVVLPGSVGGMGRRDDIGGSLRARTLARTDRAGAAAWLIISRDDPSGRPDSW
jgi:hypothetical protein